MEVLEEWMAQSRYSRNTNIFLLFLLRILEEKKITYYLNITSVMLARVLITPSFSLELVNRILSSQTSFAGSPDGRQDLLLRNFFSSKWELIAVFYLKESVVPHTC